LLPDFAPRLCSPTLLPDFAPRLCSPTPILGGDDPPADPSELAFLALDTATPYLAEYTGAQAGKKAHYMFGWVSTHRDKGPWSETVSATIGG